jgi:hypothetical protein
MTATPCDKEGNCSHLKKVEEQAEKATRAMMASRKKLAAALEEVKRLRARVAYLERDSDVS